MTYVCAVILGVTFKLLHEKALRHRVIFAFTNVLPARLIPSSSVVVVTVLFPSGSLCPSVPQSRL